MKINIIRAANYKSFNNMEQQFGDFTVLIGANAAGKSNLLSVFRFIRDVVRYGLENAVSLQGGTKYLKNVKLNKKTISFGFALSFDTEENMKFKHAQSEITLSPILMRCDFELSVQENGRYKIFSDNTEIEYEAMSEQNTCHIKLKTERKKSGIKFSIPKNSLMLTTADILPGYLSERFSTKDNSAEPCLLIEENLSFIPFFSEAVSALKNISFYDFDSKLPKRASHFMGKAELEENGENLAIVLKRILADKDSRRMFFNLINDLLPFVKNLEVVQFVDNYLQLMLSESYHGKLHDLPSSMMSDGTVFIINILTALYFEKKSIIVFEEPERRIHPYLISKIVDMMHECSENKQIILSTHNPEIVKHANLDALHFVSRDDEGFTSVVRPKDKAEIHTFIKNEIGIEELYVQNLLGL